MLKQYFLPGIAAAGSVFGALLCVWRSGSGAPETLPPPQEHGAGNAYYSGKPHRQPKKMLIKNSSF